MLSGVYYYRFYMPPGSPVKIFAGSAGSPDSGDGCRICRGPILIYFGKPANSQGPENQQGMDGLHNTRP